MIALGLGGCLFISMIIHMRTIPGLHQHFMILFPVLLSALFFDGIVLSKLLGICPLLNKSRQIDAAWKMGIAVIIVMTLSTSLNWVVYNSVLVRCSDLIARYSSLPIRLEKIFYLTVFIVTIAVFVQVLSVLLRKFAKNVYEQMGQFLELITVNCIVLASATFTIPTGAKFLVTDSDGVWVRTSLDDGRRVARLVKTSAFVRSRLRHGMKILLQSAAGYHGSYIYGYWDDSYFLTVGEIV